MTREKAFVRNSLSKFQSFVYARVFGVWAPSSNRALIVLTSLLVVGIPESQAVGTS
jgi:hypothetical protein